MFREVKVGGSGGRSPPVKQGGLGGRQAPQLCRKCKENVKNVKRTFEKCKELKKNQTRLERGEDVTVFVLGPPSVLDGLGAIQVPGNARRHDIYQVTKEHKNQI